MDVNIDIPGINNKTGISRYEDDPDIYLPILRSFLSDAESIAEKLSSVTKETLSDYVIRVHGLKGICASVGAEELREKAATLELLAKSGDMEGVLAENDELLQKTHRLIADVSEWLRLYESENKKTLQPEPKREVLIRLQKSCEAFDIEGIDSAMDELEQSDYETGGELIIWLKEKLTNSDFMEIAERLDRI